MSTFTQAKELALAEINGRIIAALNSSAPVRIYDTGCGGSEHSYQVEKNREIAASRDRESSRQASIHRNMRRKLEACFDLESVRSMVLSELAFYGVRNVQVDQSGHLREGELLDSMSDGARSFFAERVRELVRIFRTFAQVQGGSPGGSASA